MGPIGKTPRIDPKKCRPSFAPSWVRVRLSELFKSNERICTTINQMSSDIDDEVETNISAT